MTALAALACLAALAGRAEAGGPVAFKATVESLHVDDTGEVEEELLFTLYRDVDCTEVLWRESQTVTIRSGLLEVSLGLTEPLDLELLTRYPSYFITIQIRGVESASVEVALSPWGLRRVALESSLWSGREASVGAGAGHEEEDSYR